MGQVKKYLAFSLFTVKEYWWDLSQGCFSSKYIPLCFLIPIMNRDGDIRLSIAKTTESGVRTDPSGRCEAVKCVSSSCKISKLGFLHP